MGSATVGLVALSGCLGAEGAEEVDTAMELLDENFEQFEAFDERDDPPDEAALEAIETRLDEAESYLEDAAAVADDDEVLAAIELGGAFVAFQRALVRVVGGFVELEHGMDSFDAYIDAERFDDAIAEAELLQTTVDELEAAVDDALAAIDAVDDSQLEAEDRISVTLTKSDLERIASEASALEEVIGGLGDLADGLQAITDGFEALEAEDFDTARDAFSAAEEELAPIVDRYTRLEDDADLPAHMEADVIGLSCVAEAMRDAATLAEEGATAGMNEEWDTFDDRLEQAEEAMDRC